MQTPGLLDSVRLVEVEEPPLGPGEVEVAVAAAGLNFRDVMLALDLLPPLALQELQGTDRLGLECGRHRRSRSEARSRGSRPATR